MKTVRAKALTLCAIFALSGCKVGLQDASTLGSVSVSAPGVPPGSAVPHGSDQSLGFQLGEGMGSCRPGPNGTIICDDGAGNITVKDRETQQIISTTPATAIATPAIQAAIPTPTIGAVAFPTVDPASEKWFVGDKTSYYQRLPGSDYSQHFNADGTPTGWYINRNTNQLVKPQNGQFNPTSYTPGASDNVFNAVAYNGGYKIEQVALQDGSLRPTGLTYYDGTIKQPANGNTPAKTGWGQMYQLDVDQYAKYNPNAQILDYLKQNNQSGTVLLDRFPPTYQNGQTVNYYPTSYLNSVWVQPGQNAGVVQQQQQVTSAGTNTTATTGTATGKPGRTDFLLVSGIGCGACPPAIAKAKRLGIPVVEIPMTANNQYGATYFPFWKPYEPSE